MEWLAYVVAVLFSLLGLLCLLLVVLGLPGTWLMIVLAVGVELLDRQYLEGAHPETFGWWLIGVCVVLAGIGEVLEAGAGAAGTRVGGGSRRGMVGAIIGGLVGAIVLTPLIPILVVGTLLGAMIGTFVGALIAELGAERAPGVERPMKAAPGATLGRLFGTLGKTMIATVVWIALSTAAFVV